jgi:hypothetical protein
MPTRLLRKATVAIGAIGLLAAGCGGSPRKPAAEMRSALAFAGCMRTNGVSKYPDPTGDGRLAKESLAQLGVTGSQFASANNACRHLLPNGGSPPSAGQQEAVKALGLHFSQCVRAHGLPNFPDPAGDGRIPDPAGLGIDQGSPKFRAANQACAAYRPPYMPSNAAYAAWARSHPSGS